MHDRKSAVIGTSRTDKTNTLLNIIGAVYASEAAQSRHMALPEKCRHRWLYQRSGDHQDRMVLTASWLQPVKILILEPNNNGKRYWTQVSAGDTSLG